MVNTAQEHLKDPCFYVPGSSTIIDIAVLRDGVWRSEIEGEDINQIRLRYPKAELGDFNRVFEKVEASYRTEPIEITEDEFHYALEVLPPVGWRTAKGVESFKMSERYYGQITSIYVRVGKRYFTFRDTITLAAEQIADLVAQSDAFKRKPLQFMTLAEFEQLNAHFYANSYGSDERPERDFHLLTARINLLNQRQGPRIGDFVIMPDETVLRFTYDWSDVRGGIQTTCPKTCDQSFYFSNQGFCDYSGSHDQPLPIEALEDTLQNQQGLIWFFHRDYARADNSVQAKVPFRVYRYRSATQAT